MLKVSGLDRTTISRMESGRAATLLTLIQVLRAFG
ncbi:MAG: helix-turn-helix domain-containing protein [Ignavibacteria bacterium]|nr:helix-turn-helix domain-containing protein [Ignavibacteria bacterium]